MNFKHIFTFLMIVSLIPDLSMAQEMPVDSKQAMERFTLMTGEWEGMAYHSNREGGTDTIYQHENVEFLLNNTILNVEGTGKNAAGEMVFNAFATMFYDTEANAYTMYAFRDNGQSTKAAIQFTGPTTFTWSFSPNPYAHIKYETEVTQSTWKEKGYYSRDKETWTPMFSMELDRVE